MSLPAPISLKNVFKSSEDDLITQQKYELLQEKNRPRKCFLQ